MLNIYYPNLELIKSSVKNSWASTSSNIYTGKIIYHITINALERRGNFMGFNGRRIDEKVEGKILRKVWGDMQYLFPYCVFKDCCVKTDKFHGIILVDDRLYNSSNKIIASAVEELKSRSTKLINIIRMTFGRIFWENSFKQDVITSYTELYGLVNFVWEYD
ncbi:MAG: hypothetical protein L0Y79_13395 [Chlorobi bacterium]|nr:hypothetical protein [Chlorobiota bacterium]MCI0717255.1 hypothetical protein [Chlorobiota bacterium]